MSEIFAVPLPLRPSDHAAGLTWLLTIEAPGVPGSLVHWRSRVVEVEGLPGMVGPGVIDVDELRDDDPRVEGGVTVEVQWPTSGQLAALLGRGEEIAGGRGELALVPSVGATWARRLVVSRGLVQEPDVGRDDEPVSLALIMPEIMADRVGVAFPTEDMRIVEEAFLVEEPPEGEADKHYVLVYGAPGLDYGDLSGRYTPSPGSPAPVLQTFEAEYTDEVYDPETEVAGEVQVIEDWADHLFLTLGRARATTVLLWYTRDGKARRYGDPIPVALGEDARRRVYSYADLGGIKVPAMRRGAPFYVSWGTGRNQGTFDLTIGAHTAYVPFPGAAAYGGTGLVSVWEDLARRMRVPIDEPRLAEARAALNAYVLDCYVDAPAQLLEWSDAHLGPFPCTVEHGPAGLYLRPVVWEAQPSQAVAHLVVGTLGVSLPEAAAPLRALAAMEQADGVRLRFARRADTDTLQRTIVVDAGGRHVPNAAVPAAWRLLDVDVPDAWRASTAILVARYQAWARCAPRRVVVLRVDVARWGHLQIDDIVTVTGADIGLARAVGVVRALTYSDMPWRVIEVLLLDRR